MVRSKWEWNSAGAPVRSTWDPEASKYSTTAKAAGLDEVFSSRLPQPFRIRALQDPADEHKGLLKLVLEPIATRLEKMLDDEKSDLNTALMQVNESAQGPVAEFAETIERVRKRVSDSYTKVFTNSQIELSVNIDNLGFKPLDALTRASSIGVSENGSAERKWHQQGTGSQRALFWSMLEVRSELKKEADAVKARIEATKKHEKEIAKLEKERDKAKTEATKTSKQEKIDELHGILKSLASSENADVSEWAGGDSILPGHMLLIDEPEIALHPSAIRAAKSHLYELARDEGWQVMLSTHNPAFIDPLEDHTTIIRLDRNDKAPTPKTYQSDSIQFSQDEKENLEMLLRFDQAVCELFFGAYPIIVEGDTEYAAFQKVMHARADDFPTESQPLIVRARGKAIIRTFIKILTEFKIPFSVLHDADAPRTNSGKKVNSMWSENKELSTLICIARDQGVDVRHRVSIPDFERHHQFQSRKNGKPYSAWSQISDSKDLMEVVRIQLMDLIADDSPHSPCDGDVIDWISDQTIAWAAENANTDPAFQFA